VTAECLDPNRPDTAVTVAAALAFFTATASSSSQGLLPLADDGSAVPPCPPSVPAAGPAVPRPSHPLPSLPATNPAVLPSPGTATGRTGTHALPTATVPRPAGSANATF
jgi:hypothetical protein